MKVIVWQRYFEHWAVGMLFSYYVDKFVHDVRMLCCHIVILMRKVAPIRHTSDVMANCVALNANATRAAYAYPSLHGGIKDGFRSEDG
jgi:hypothetical protein